MPVHNGELFIRQAIESILNQSYHNFEFIIVDNCSIDSSIQIVKSYNDNRINIVKEAICHQVDAYNRGFKEANGEIIFIADQDDISDSNRIKKQLEYIRKNNADICGSFFNIIDVGGKQIGELKLPIKDAEIKNELLFKNYTIFNSSVCLKKEVFSSIGYYKKEYFPSADYEFFLRAGKQFKFCNVPEFLYSWRQHPSQISTDKKSTQKSTMNISMYYLDQLSNNEKGNNYYLKERINILL